MAELSGKIWVKRFPGTNTLDTLNSPFKECVQQFIAALQDAKVKVKISSHPATAAKSLPNAL